MKTLPHTFLQFIQSFDEDDLKTITEHGCANGAISGLIYYSETRKVFDAYEDEIETLLDEVDYKDRDGQHAISIIINDRVWAAVELQAAMLANNEEE